MWCVLFLATLLQLDDGAIRIDKTVKPPVPIHKPEPNFPDQARRAQVQAAVLLGIIIGTDGRVRNIEVISPAGFGFEEKAVEAVQGWRFKPAEKDGKPVAVTANVEVNFRLLGAYFDARDEKRRTEFNSAVVALRKDDPQRKEKAVEVLQKLAREKYPPAMQAVGSMLLRGEQLPKDPARALTLIEQAARKDNANALYELGRLKVAGELVPKDWEAGLKLLHEAAVIGSLPAQAYLAQLYYNGGEGVTKDPQRAKRYMRLCGAGGASDCQYWLGTLLIPSSVERERMQGFAWMGLAADAGHAKAREALAQASALTPDQKEWVEKLKKQLLRRAQ